jgi:DNA-binding GntR family transcriptional regulator
MRTGTFTGVSLDWTKFEGRRGAVPLYRQLVEFVARAVKSGELESGDGLPGEQGLADATGVSVDTVRRAFEVLRQEGLIVTSTGIGSFIA